MKVKILKTCYHGTLGRLDKGQEVDVDESVAQIWHSQGGCEILAKVVDEKIETKVVKNTIKKG